MQIYVVKENDTLDSIAAAFMVSAEDIAYDNQIAAPYPLAVGQALLIPTDEENFQKREVYVNGVCQSVLRQNILKVEVNARKALFLHHQKHLVN